ncbi:histone H1.1-like [Heterodontus francisci]|uniref:histone H1.1-like n=1 Tax=Heterodontus francisci TaxID=7792 RepID=UPI00355B9C19
MTDTAGAETAPPVAAAEVKTPKKKKAAPRNRSAGPTLSEKILKIVADCSESKETSLPVIKKGLGRSGVDVGKFRKSSKNPEAGNQGKCGKESEVRSRLKTFGEENSWQESDSREISSQEITSQETSSQGIGSEESSRQESEQQEGGNAKEIPRAESSASEKVYCEEGQKTQECQGRKGAQESSIIKGQDQAESSKGSESSPWKEVKLHGKVVDI